MTTSLALVVAASFKFTLVGQTALDFELPAIFAFALDAQLFAVIGVVVVRGSGADDAAGIDRGTTGKIATDVNLGSGVALVVVILGGRRQSESAGHESGCE